jgi:hypothetical protein
MALTSPTDIDWRAAVLHGKRLLDGLMTSRPARKLGTAFAACALFGAVLHAFVDSPFAGLTRIELLEDRLARESLHLLPFPTSREPVSVRLRRADLDRYRLYARDLSRDSCLLVDGGGKASLDGAALPIVAREVHVHLGRNATSLYIDGERVDVDLTGWELFYLTSRLEPPAGAVRSYSEIDMADSFMRNDLFDDGNWRSMSGEWSLSKRGAGLVKVEARRHLTSAGIARTVNPFSVRGSGNGMLTYGEADALDYRVEASFYFGAPQTMQVRDTGTLPGSFGLAQGKPGGGRVAFGWDRGAERFVLKEHVDGEWRIVAKWRDIRPPITSWCRLGLEVEDGYRASGWLDGVRVLEHDCRRFISGPPHVATGAGLIEVDDVRAFGLGPDRPAEPEGDTLFVRSTNFAIKDFTEHDELQYAKWARGDAIFRRTAEGEVKFITSTSAVPGDVRYTSVPYDAGAGELAEGAYVFRFLEGSALGSDNPGKQRELFSLRARRAERSWTIEDERYPAVNGMTVSALRISRLAELGNRPAVFVDRWVPIADAVDGFVHVSVGCDARMPSPEHHEFRGSNIANELFEEAATEWSWTEGKFRMAARWACMSAWNFMACGGTGTPWMAGKKTFWGDQSHDYFMSIRAVQPPDGGDENFHFDENEDRKVEHIRLRQNHGWYNRHNLNFAFCTDGVNPMSGYAVVYAARENTRNYLLREGKVVAENSLNLMPGHRTNWGAVHWKWWDFRCALSGDRVVVMLNDEVLFDFTDASPLEGGHVGFFTARNGFTVAKIASMAERIDRDPFFMWVDAPRDDGPANSDWHPLVRDDVKVERSGRGVRVSSRIGGGALAMRHHCGGVDLAEKPVLEFPLAVAPGTAVNLFLSISGRAYVVGLNDSPLTMTKALLTPEFESGEMFQLPYADIGPGSPHYLGEIAVAGELRLDLQALLEDKGVAAPYRLDSVTIGNSSEEGFLNFGATANRRGAGYRVGTVTHGR